MFRAEIKIRGSTAREQRDAIADTLRRLADRVASDHAPLAGSSRVTIMTEGALAGAGWFELAQARLVG